MDSFVYKDVKIIVRRGDITDQPVDAIVNPANEHLNNAGGAARAIADGAGEEFAKECEQYIEEHKILPTGKVCVTTAGDLPCRYVFHTPGPK